MKKLIEKIDSKKEYDAPQMEVMALDVKGTMLSGSCGDNCGDIIDDTGN